MRTPWGFFKQYPQFKYLWSNINCRCNKQYDSKYYYYGGKGIRNKLKQKDLLTLWSRDKAYLLSKPSLDRIDSDKHYSLDNCRFIEADENRKNRAGYVANSRFRHEFGSIWKKLVWCKQRDIDYRFFRILIGKDKRYIYSKHQKNKIKSLCKKLKIKVDDYFEWKK